MTVRAKIVFTVKEYADGKPWIALETLDRPLRGEGLPSGIFGLDLRLGTTTEQADKVAKYLNDHVEGVGFTGFAPMPFA